MKHRILGVMGAFALIAGLALSTSAAAGADGWHHGWHSRQTPAANLNIVHGIPGLYYPGCLTCLQFIAVSGSPLLDVAVYKAN